MIDGEEDEDRTLHEGVSREDFKEDTDNLKEIPTLDSVIASTDVPDYIPNAKVFHSIKEVDDRITMGLNFGNKYDVSILTRNLIPCELIADEDHNVWTVESLTLDVSRFLSDKIEI